MTEADRQITEEFAGDEFEPEKEYLIRDLDTLKVATDPMRIRILEAMAEQSRTVKQIARILETNPTKLYYHINLLEEKGLIRVTGQRIVSGIIEKRYRLRALSFQVDRALFEFDEEGDDSSLDRVLSVIFDMTRQDIKEGVREGLINILENEASKRNAMFARTITRLRPDQFAQFCDKLDTLIKEFSAMGDSSAPNQAQAYGFTLAIYPLVKLNDIVDLGEAPDQPG